MKYSKSFLSIIGLLFALSLLVASVTGKVAMESLNSPNFSYSPTATPDRGSADITMALISPIYSNISATGEPFKSFKKSLESEILEALTAKGYAVRGPFASRDEMIFSDKESSHLALIIDIQPELAKASGAWKSVRMKSGNTAYMFHKGTVNVYGKVNLTAMEPISGEKMWAKSVSIPQQTTRVFTSSKVFTGSANTADLKVLSILAEAGDANVANPLSEALEASFSDIMDKIWRHLDPEEFQRMKPKIAELKSK